MPEKFIAVGVGNSSVQIARFEHCARSAKSNPVAQATSTTSPALALPQPLSREVFPSRNDDGKPKRDWDELKSIITAASASQATQADTKPTAWYIACVFRETTDAVVKWVTENDPKAIVKIFANDDFPIEIATESPSLVGTDRIAAATAVAHQKDADRPAIFVDAGTALTVNAVSSSGAFLGGAILPGTTTSGTALNKSTDQLPRIIVSADKPAPQAIGPATNAAISSGIYWGSVGAVKELIERMTVELAEQGEAQAPQVYVTGGFGPALAKQLGDSGTCIPHLVLSGIALAVLK